MHYLQKTQELAFHECVYELSDEKIKCTCGVAPGMCGGLRRCICSQSMEDRTSSQCLAS